MSDTEIIYISQQNEENKIVSNLIKYGFSPRWVNYKDIEKLNFPHPCAIIIDIDSNNLSSAIEKLSSLKGFDEAIKLILVDNPDIPTLDWQVKNYDFIIRPVDSINLSLLIEKTVLVDRYRNMMGLLAKESESRIGILEHLINLKGSAESDFSTERDLFLKVLDLEKKLLQEQLSLNESIRNIALFRKNEYISMKDRIKAEELLADLRRKELIDTRSTISAQENLIDFSSKELHEAKKIIDARESVEELGRLEAIQLHEEIKALKKNIVELEKEIAKLKKENEELKRKK
jgi:vacuolar-type H+-ATPase subunit I/STV1